MARLTPDLDPAERARAAARAGPGARVLGRPLNILRLLKAAFTFEGAMDYVAWKVERHSGVRIEVAPWQRRFPLLAAPGLYWKLQATGRARSSYSQPARAVPGHGLAESLAELIARLPAGGPRPFRRAHRPVAMPQLAAASGD